MEFKHMSDARLDIALDLLDFVVHHCRDDGPCYAQDLHSGVNLLYIIP